MSEEKFPDDLFGEPTEPGSEARRLENFLSQEKIPGQPPPDWLAERGSEMENITPRKLYEKEMKVAAVYDRTAPTGHHAYFVLLRELRDAGRELEIYVGYPEAQSISIVASQQSFNRPLTHDLLKLVVERLGWKVERMTIDDLYNNTFYAKLTLAQNGESIDIDCRPSDAIALAMRAQARIYVAEHVIVAAIKDNEPENTAE